MPKPIIKIVNSQTGEEVEREMTKAELEAFETMQAQAESLRLEQQAKEAARQSALEKLAALGLTEAEIQALAG